MKFDAHGRIIMVRAKIETGNTLTRKPKNRLIISG